MHDADRGVVDLGGLPDETRSPLLDLSAREVERHGYRRRRQLSFEDRFQVVEPAQPRAGVSQRDGIFPAVRARSPAHTPEKAEATANIPSAAIAARLTVFIARMTA